MLSDNDTSSSRTFTFTPNYGDWPINSFDQGETEELRMKLTPRLTEDLVEFAHIFQEAYDYETGEFVAAISRDDYRVLYEALSRRLHAEGVPVELDYWWDSKTP